MTVTVPHPRDGPSLPPSFTVCVSSSPEERGRVAAALDGQALLVIVADAQTALEVLSRRRPGRPARRRRARRTARAARGRPPAGDRHLGRPAARRVPPRARGARLPGGLARCRVEPRGAPRGGLGHPLRRRPRQRLLAGQAAAPQAHRARGRPRPGRRARRRVPAGAAPRCAGGAARHPAAGALAGRAPSRPDGRSVDQQRDAHLDRRQRPVQARRGAARRGSRPGRRGPSRRGPRPRRRRSAGARTATRGRTSRGAIAWSRVSTSARSPSSSAQRRRDVGDRSTGAVDVAEPRLATDQDHTLAERRVVVEVDPAVVRGVDHPVVGDHDQPGVAGHRVAQLLGLGVDERQLLEPLGGGDAVAVPGPVEVAVVEVGEGRASRRPR